MEGLLLREVRRKLDGGFQNMLSEECMEEEENQFTLH